MNAAVPPSEVLFRSFTDAVDRALEPRSGAVPAGLRGTLVRNGPGRMALGGHLLHPLDGHALLAAVRFEDGGARLRTREVATPELAAEVAAGRPLWRRILTNRPGRLANVLRLDRALGANHDVYASGGRLIAADDRHVALDAATLDDLGPVVWDPGAVGQRQGPMPRLDPATGRTVGYLFADGKTRPDAITFVELDADLRVVSKAAPCPLPASPAVVHDLGATPRWYVVTRAAARIRLLDALLGRRTLFQSFGWPDAARLGLTLVARPDGGRAVHVDLPAPARAAFHVAGCHEEGERVVVDLVVYDDPVSFDRLAPAAQRRGWGAEDGVGARPCLRRYVIDPATAAVVEARDLTATPVELPTTDPRRQGLPRRHLWAATPGAPTPEPDPHAFAYFHGIAAVDLQTGATATWDAGAGRYVTQPAFAPRGPDEGDGWLLAFVLDTVAGETRVVVLDARRVADGPVAVLGTGIALPVSNHVRWAPAA